ncbi:ATP-binding protein, partial [Moorena sp. SIO4E2]|uniref:sensor histidine kinase n=1 Tax=Moorena sp. SIO4E2 TaxID=2607826 RepID=UPI00257FB063
FGSSQWQPIRDKLIEVGSRWQGAKKEEMYILLDFPEEKFIQLQEEDSLRRTVGGTGLGLAICRQIIKGMGGKIWAKSEGKNQGSQFHFTIPLESSQILLSIES